MLKLYRYSEDFGRMGHLSGTFVADDKDVDACMWHDVYLGEVLGKHSNITAELSDKTLKVLTDDQDFIKKFQELKCSSGTNPVDAYLNP